MFSPSLTAPLRSSPARWMYGGRSNAPQLSPSACTPPGVPSRISNRQAKSRSMPLGWPPPVSLAKNPVLAGCSCGRWFQFRLTRILPKPRPAPLSSEILSPRFSSVIFESEIFGAGAGAGAGVGANAGAGAGAGTGAAADDAASVPPKCASSAAMPPLKPWPTAPKRQAPSRRYTSARITAFSSAKSAPLNGKVAAPPMAMLPGAIARMVPPPSSAPVNTRRSIEAGKASRLSWNVAAPADRVRRTAPSGLASWL